MNILNQARDLRAKIERLSNMMTDKEALMAIPLCPVWRKDVNYIVGDRVQYDDILYRCLIDHTSQLTWTPDVSPSLFARILIPDSEIIPDWEQPGSTNPYMNRDKVKHKDKTWVSICDNNVWEPGIYGWEEIVI